MYLFLKRVLDIIVSVIIMILLSPLAVPIIIILSLTAEKKIFYRQKRIGLNNKPFNIYKFATMLEDSPNLGTGLITVKNDYRVTKFGKYLRLTKINELPQIQNVLFGHMSLVGPRPLVRQIFDNFPEESKNRFYKCKPGITGIGSVIFRDEESLIANSSLPPDECYKKFIAPYKAELEIWYQGNASMRTDLLIIFLTAWVIFFPGSNLPFKIFSDLPKRQEIKVVDTNLSVAVSRQQ